MNHDDIPTPHDEDPEMRTELALLDIHDLVAQMDKQLTMLVEGYKSHHAAILAHIEQIDDLRHRVEILENSRG